MYRGMGDTFVLPADAATVATSPFDTGANALIAAGYGDSSTTVDTSTGLPSYVASPSNLVPSAVPASGAGPKSTTTISPMLIAGGAGLLLLLVVMGGRRR